MNKAALRQLQGDAVDIKEKAKNNRPDPALISGGMGVRISCWRLARIVSMMDGLGVVSGTGLELVYPRILQNGDPGGHTRRAFDELARRQPALAEPLRRLFDNYYIKGGKAAGKPYKPVPVWKLNRIEGYGRGPDSFWEPAREPQILSIAANFAEVWLAKEGHGGLVGINFLRKIERPMPCALYGAILAGVDYVVIGAGNPSHIPGMLRLLSRHEPASMPLKVYGTRSDSGEFSVLARPRAFVGDRAAALPPPKFLAIVSSFGLAQALRMIARGELKVTDTMVSPTGFPFKVAQLPGTLADGAVYQGRRRVCDISMLQANYLTAEGELGYRCSAEPVDSFIAKGGRAQNTAGRACLCNGLLAAAGFAQTRADGYVEPAIVTLGEDLQPVRDLLALLSPGQDSYTIGKAIRFLRQTIKADD